MSRAYVEKWLSGDPRANGEAVAPAGVKIGAPAVRHFSDIEEQKIEWLWPGVFPLGKLSVIQGDPGLGKSFLTIDIAARVSSGTSFPGELINPAVIREPGSVILISSEDDAADTIKPRLRVAGADCSRVLELTGRTDAKGRTIPFVLDEEGQACLENAIRAADNCRLVVIDPISAYMGGADSHNNAEVRGVLGPLSQVAARTRVAIVMVTHMNKGGGGNSVYRGMGSLAFNAAARAVWTVLRADPDKDPNHTASTRLFLCSKLNIAKDHNGRSYDLVDATGEDHVRLRWSAEVLDMRADDAMNGNAPPPGPKPAKTEGCMNFIREQLAAGQLASATLQKRCEDAGFSGKVIREARERVGVVSRQIGGQWVSCLDTHPETIDMDIGGFPV